MRGCRIGFKPPSSRRLRHPRAFRQPPYSTNCTKIYRLLCGKVHGGTGQSSSSARHTHGHQPLAQCQLSPAWAPPPSLIPACCWLPASLTPQTCFGSRLNFWKAALAGNQPKVLCCQKKVVNKKSWVVLWCRAGQSRVVPGPKTGLPSRIRLAPCLLQPPCLLSPLASMSVFRLPG